VHAHSHGVETTHDPARHEHSHARALSLRALLAGIVHGLAGSGALILLTVESIHSVGLGMAYIALFALGTLAGMALLTAAISLPLKFLSQRLTVVHAAVQAMVGAGTLTLGLSIMHSLLRP
jgi:hypothetical protein